MRPYSISVASQVYGEISDHFTKACIIGIVYEYSAAVCAVRHRIRKEHFTAELSNVSKFKAVLVVSNNYTPSFTTLRTVIHSWV